MIGYAYRTETEKHVEMLDFLIKNTTDKTIRSTLIAAHNRLLRDVTAVKAGARRPADWPCCARCETPYTWQSTGNDYVHEVRPVCDCKAGVLWSEARPAGMWNELDLEV